MVTHTSAPRSRYNPRPSRCQPCSESRASDAASSRWAQLALAVRGRRQPQPPRPRTRPTSSRRWRRPPSASPSSSPAPRAWSSPSRSTSSRSATGCRATVPAARWNPSFGCRGRPAPTATAPPKPRPYGWSQGQRPHAAGQRPQQLHHARAARHRDPGAVDAAARASATTTPGRWPAAARSTAAPPSSLDFQEKADESRSTSRSSRATTTASATTSRAACADASGSTPRSYDVLRMDQRLGGQVEVQLPRRAAATAGCRTRSGRSSASTRPTASSACASTNPEETLVLPVSSTSLRITRGAGTPRLRVNTEYKQYRRFITGGRLISEPQQD